MGQYAQGNQKQQKCHFHKKNAGSVQKHSVYAASRRSFYSSAHLMLFYFLLLARFLNVGSRIFLRIRSVEGVISSSSSVSMKSSACSRLMILGGVSRSASSALEERVLVSCFFLHTLISISSLFPVCPTTMPLYTFSPGPMNRMPLSWALYRP